jgi:uncharacterized protein (TIGR00369 family)
MHQTTVSLPESVYEQFGDDEKSVAETLESLAAEHAELQRSITTYTDHGDSPSARNEAEVGPATLSKRRPPIGQLLGFDLESAEPGQATISFQPGPEHANPMGTLHGGVLCDIGDAAMGIAYGTTLDSSESFTTLELDIKFLRPVWDQPLTATGTVLNSGRTIGLVECDVTDPDEELVAHLQSTCMTLRDESAEGR